MQAVILAGKGQSKNLSPFIETRVKPQFSVGGETILIRLIKQLIESNIKEIFIVIDSYCDKIKALVHDSAMTKATIKFIELNSPLGIGHAIHSCSEFINQDQHFYLVYGDTIFEANPFPKLYQQFLQFNNQYLASVSHSSTAGKFSTIYFDHNLNITSIQDKEKSHNYVLSGCFLFDANLFRLLEKYQFDMSEVLKQLSIEKTMNACILETAWLDITYPWDILTANQILLEQLSGCQIAETAQIHSNVDIQGNVYIGNGSIIRAGSAIYGPCYIGHNVIINNNSFVRDHSSIMDNCSIGFSTEIKNSIISQNSNIERLSYIGDSIVGENVSIDSCCITVNYKDGDKIECQIIDETIQTNKVKLGTFIGDHAKISANQTYQPARIIPAHYIN